VLKFREFLRLPILDEIIFSPDGKNLQVLREGKWIPGRFEKNIRIDRATHLGSGEKHAHVYGRKGELIGAIKADGTKSHGGRSFRVHTDDAEALRAQGIAVPKNRVVELYDIQIDNRILLG
jgi:hypothetical protein